MAACLISCRPLLTKAIQSHFTVSVMTWTRRTVLRTTTVGATEGSALGKSVGEGDYYKLDALAKPDQIHAQKKFAASSSDDVV